MSEKKVTVIVDKNGKMAMSFEGFEGSSCYDEARRIQTHLKSLGIEVDCESLIPKESVERVVGVPNELKH